MPERSLQTATLRPAHGVFASLTPMLLALGVLTLPIAYGLSGGFAELDSAPPSQVVFVEYLKTEPVAAPPIVVEQSTPPPALEEYAQAPEAGAAEQEEVEAEITEPQQRGKTLAEIQIRGIAGIGSPSFLKIAASSARPLAALPSVSAAPSKGMLINAAIEGVEAEHAAPAHEDLSLETLSYAGGRAGVAARIVAPLPTSRGSGFSPRSLSEALPGDTAGTSDMEGDGAIEGVPLDSLASCDTREREDRLKQELMLAARSGSQCTGPGGSYHFLETRNLNAFLIRVERERGRALGNRCDELMRAQECVNARRSRGN